MTSQPDDEGFTLVEVLVAMIVLGIGIAALMSAMGTHVKTTVANRNQAIATSTLTAAAEYVKSYQWNPVLAAGTCPAISGATLTSNGPTAPTGLAITYSDGQSMPSASMCELQRVTVHVVGFGYDLSVDVAKRALNEVAP